jgi:pSer/pThr/pTyr-binding forkhead associated (FHA) protein
MAKLIMSLDNAVIREVPLDKERLTIGRKPHNDIQIDNLAVSGEHCLIVTLLNDSFLEDLGSTNGTLVNGNPIKKHILQTNDVIEVGKYKLKYVTDQAGGATSVADFEKTMVLHRPAPKAGVTAQPSGFGDTQVNPSSITSHSQPTQTATSTTKPPERPALAAIQILTGASAGKELELTKNLTTLGKPGVQVAVITRRPHGYFLTHVEGASFPVVNGKPLDAQAHPLHDHDVVELAGVKMEFFLKNA